MHPFVTQGELEVGCFKEGGGGEGAKISYYSLAMSFHQVGQLAVAFSSQGSPQGSPV